MAIYQFGFRASISSFRFRVFDFEFSISSFRFRVFDFEFSISSFRFRVFELRIKKIALARNVLRPHGADCKKITGKKMYLKNYRVAGEDRGRVRSPLPGELNKFPPGFPPFPTLMEMPKIGDFLVLGHQKTASHHI